MMEDAIAHCNQRLSSMLDAQKDYHDSDVAKNQPALTRALRRFREEHFAFLNAGYSLGDTLKRAVVRQFMRSDVEPGLQSPLFAFHRGLRDALDHGGFIEYGLTINIEMTVAILPHSTFPIPDIPTAARYGMLKAEQEVPRLGTRYFVYQEQHLESALWATLKEVQSDLNLPLELSVMRLSQLYLDEISDLCRRAVRENRLKPETTGSASGDGTS
jgi:hypothetical protein